MGNGYNIKITSVIEELDSAGLAVSSETSEESAPCTLAEGADGTVTVSFTERSEGGEARARIVYRDGGLRVLRTGAIESKLVFTEGGTHKTLYKIPPYAFDATVTTKRLCGTLTREGGELAVIYIMSIGGADKRVRMKISLTRGAV